MTEQQTTDPQAYPTTSTTVPPAPDADPQQPPVEVDGTTSGAQLEAAGVETVAFEWNGHRLTMPASMDDWPIVAQLAFEEGKPATGVRSVLGPKQFALLVAAGYVNRDLNDLSAQMLKVLGLGDLGE